MRNNKAINWREKCYRKKRQIGWVFTPFNFCCLYSASKSIGFCLALDVGYLMPAGIQAFAFH